MRARGLDNYLQGRKKLNLDTSHEGDKKGDHLSFDECSMWILI